MIYYFHMLNIYPSEHSLSNANLIGCDLLYTIQSLITGLFSQYKWQLNSVWHTPVSLSLCIYLPRRTADSFEAATKKSAATHTVTPVQPPLLPLCLTPKTQSKIERQSSEMWGEEYTDIVCNEWKKQKRFSIWVTVCLQDSLFASITVGGGY